MIIHLIAEILIPVEGLEAQCYETLFFQPFWNVSAAYLPVKPPNFNLY